MLPFQKEISVFAELGNLLLKKSAILDDIIEQTYQYNNWFTEENIRLAVKNISEKYLNEKKLSQWMAKYAFPQNQPPKTIGIVMAGNIPMVGFHDLHCVLMSGNIAQIKLSSKDKFLIPFIVKKLNEINRLFEKKIFFNEVLKKFDAVIATGSNNSARYFDSYFAKYPHIIRRHRNSVAIIGGDESYDDFQQLGHDIFQYFGMGCRNVSKLYVPENYSFNEFFGAMESFKEVMNHHKYKNNYDYNCTLLLMNKTKFLSNDFLMITENIAIASPIAILHFEYYKDENDLKNKLKEKKNEIQSVYDKTNFGSSQSPELWDYADGMDTMKFIMELYSQPDKTNE